jgi:hypothetical protein
VTAIAYGPPPPTGPARTTRRSCLRLLPGTDLPVRVAPRHWELAGATRSRHNRPDLATAQISRPPGQASGPQYSESRPLIYRALGAAVGGDPNAPDLVLRGEARGVRPKSALPRAPRSRRSAHPAISQYSWFLGRMPARTASPHVRLPVRRYGEDTGPPVRRGRGPAWPRLPVGTANAAGRCGRDACGPGGGPPDGAIGVGEAGGRERDLSVGAAEWLGWLGWLVRGAAKRLWKLGVDLVVGRST